jgi:hypothetical protein
MSSPSLPIKWNLSPSVSSLQSPADYVGGGFLYFCLKRLTMEVLEKLTIHSLSTLTLEICYNISNQMDQLREIIIKHDKGVPIQELSQEFSLEYGIIKDILSLHAKDTAMRINEEIEEIREKQKKRFEILAERKNLSNVKMGKEYKDYVTNKEQTEFKRLLKRGGWSGYAPVY